MFTVGFEVGFYEPCLTAEGDFVMENALYAFKSCDGNEFQ